MGNQTNIPSNYQAWNQMEMGGHVTPDCVVLEAQVPTAQRVRDRLGLTACLDMVIQKSDVPCLDEKRTLALQLAVSHYTEMGY
jgi:hypothetical protein